MSRKKRKVRKTVGKILECGIYFFSWYFESRKDKMIDKEEQKELINSLLDIVGDTDIELE